MAVSSRFPATAIAAATATATASGFKAQGSRLKAHEGFCNIGRYDDHIGKDFSRHKYSEINCLREVAC